MITKDIQCNKRNYFTKSFIPKDMKMLNNAPLPEREAVERSIDPRFIALHFIPDYAFTYRGFAPQRFAKMVQCAKVLKGQFVEALGAMKWNPVSRKCLSMHRSLNAKQSKEAFQFP